MQRVALAKITDSPFQKRSIYEQSADWPDFVASVKEHGVTQPCIGREVNGHIELVNGHRRKRASVAAKLTDLPIIIRTLTDAQVRELLAIENLQRENLSALDEAREYDDWKQALLKAGTVKTVEEAVAHICGKINRKRSAVFQRLALLKLSPTVAKAVQDGSLDASKAGLIATVPDESAQKEILVTATNENYNGGTMSYRKLQEHIEENYQVSLKDAPFELSKTYDGDVKMPDKSTLMLHLRGPCTDCKFRSGQQCAQPACYAGKRNAAQLLQMATAKAKGKKAFTSAEFEKVKSDYVFADDYSRSPGNYYDSWKTVVGNRAPEVVLVQTDDALRTAYLKTDAIAAAKKNGVKFEDPRAETPEQKAKRKAKEAELAVRVAQMQDFCITQLPALAKGLEKMKDSTAWEIAAEMMETECYTNEDYEAVLLKGKKGKAAVLGRLFSAEEYAPVNYQGEWDKGVVKNWKLAGVDLVKGFEKQEKQAKAWADGKIKKHPLEDKLNPEVKGKKKAKK